MTENLISRGVCLVVGAGDGTDGAIDGAFIRSRRDDADALLGRDEILKPDDIAANYVMLHKQPRSAWTFELDLRPWAENW